MSEIALYGRYRRNRAQRLTELYERIKAIRATLAPAALAYFDQQIKQWEDGGAPPNLLPGMAVLWEPDYRVPPVPIREFIYNPTFSGAR
jgi:hypothetical protein